MTSASSFALFMPSGHLSLRLLVITEDAPHHFMISYGVLESFHDIIGDIIGDTMGDIME